MFIIVIVNIVVSLGEDLKKKFYQRGGAIQLCILGLEI